VSPMRKPTAPTPVAVDHAHHSGALLTCPDCRRASDGTFGRRLSALRARR